VFNDNGYITSCDESILHGAYDEGSSPSMILYTAPTINDGSPTLGVAEVHSGFPTGTIDYNGCGYPVNFDGVVIDGWKLPPLPPTISKKKTTTNQSLITVPKMNLTLPKDDPQTCDECRALWFISQAEAIQDHSLIQDIVNTLAASCGIDDIIVGDGTISGCKNLIYLYGKELTVEALLTALSPDNCIALGYCSSQEKPPTFVNPFKYSRKKLIEMITISMRKKIGQARRK